MDVNPEAMATDLAQSWEVLGEAVQTVMRKHGMPEPYEQLKAATRGRKMSKEVFADILQELSLPEAARKELEDLVPAVNIGVAAELALRDS